MLLKVRHESRYHYDRPVSYALQRLRMTPRTNSVQTVLDWNVTCIGATREVKYIDGYDNIVELVRHERNASEIALVAEGTVSTIDTSGVFGLDPVNIPTSMFLRETSLTNPGNEIADLAASISALQSELERMHALKEKLHARLTFDPGVTDTSTNAEDALVSGHGVCQDYAQIFIATARLTAVPARYVSGYLLIPGMEQQTASHAWAEAFISGLGWVGFDAANNTCPNEHYVRVAVGLDYRDAAPVSGIRMGEANEKLAVNLKVEQ